MQKKLIEIGVAVLILLGGIWLAVSTADLQEELQIFLVISAILLAGLFLFFPKIPFDYKIICMLIIGYAKAGKGFAYITPFEPFYIGEIIWCVGLLGYIYRLTKGTQLLPTWLHIAMLLWMVTIGLYLLRDYPLYGKLAIRDSAIGYYAMFAFYGYAIFTRTDLSKSFGRVLKFSVYCATVGLVVLTSGLHQELFGISGHSAYFYQPHSDAILPLVAAGATYALMRGVQLRSLIRVAIGLLLAFLLLLTKTAGIFCFLILLTYMIIIGRRRDLIITGCIAGILASVAILFVFSIDSAKINAWMENNQHLQTFRIGKASSVMEEDTTDWRLAWWEIIYDDTIKENPLFGLGLGGDISSHFLVSHMRLDLNSEEARNYARYPHNIIFTIFGRLGAVGLLIFMVFLISLGIVLVKVTRTLINDGSMESKTALLALLVVIAGVANGLVETTYEIPYGAITHWTCIGYILAYYKISKDKKIHISLRPREHIDKLPSFRKRATRIESI